MIEVQYKLKEAYSFHAFSLSECKKEINNAKRGKVTASSADIIASAEKTQSQKSIADKLGVSSRYLRYIKKGERLKGISTTKKDKSIRAKLLSLASSIGLKVGGGYKSGQIRAATYLDFVCERAGEINKDFHGLFYEHDASSISHINDKGFYQSRVNTIRASIGEMCQEGSYCEDVILYRRGNKHPVDNIECEHCGESLITIDNKKLIYTVVMKA